ncbi:ATP-binding protein, partial [Flavihumibacter sp. CACIAM 22H1]|uniref:PAS domain-containing sensor histidine kinase n=1 Tax=Flavihumibacter sp. CACIAM 22H1 TaxID=1812911 RepID=UPI000B1B31C9
TAVTSGVHIQKGENMLLEASYPAAHIQYWKALYDRALSGEPFHMQSMDKYTKPDQEIWWETSFNPIREGAQIVGVACHARDITMNRNYQSELWQLNQKLETAQKLAKLGYWELNLDTNELFWTMEVFSIWDRHPSNFQPGFEQFMSTLHPDDRAEFLVRRKRVLNGEEDLDFQHRILLPDGSIRFVHEKGSLFKDQLGNIIRYSGTVQDITQRKLYEQALEQANLALSERAEQLARSNAELERFAFVASHDLQEPLRMVSSFLQLLDKRYKEQVDEAGRQYINFAVTGAERMKRLINDLLEYSRIEHALANFEVVNMNQVLKEACLNLQEAIADNQASIEYDELPIIEKGNYSSMVQLLQNLLGNALKYRSEAPVLIQVGCKEEEEHWGFSVKDNGIGIESDYFEKIFIIFQRLHNMSEYSGTGIGLAICKKIVEQHGGKIWVHSIENQGSTFYFTIKK